MSAYNSLGGDFSAHLESLDDSPGVDSYLHTFQWLVQLAGIVCWNHSSVAVVQMIIIVVRQHLVHAVQTVCCSVQATIILHVHTIYSQHPGG